MEGISIGDFKYVSLNFRVFSQEEVSGWCYGLDEEDTFSIVGTMYLLDTEVLISPKILIEW